MGNSSTKLAEKCSLLAKSEVPVVASSFKLVSKNSERIKEDDLMVGISLAGARRANKFCCTFIYFLFLFLFRVHLTHSRSLMSGLFCRCCISWRSLPFGMNWHRSMLLTLVSYPRQKFWGSQMDPRLAQYITNFLFGPLGARSPVVEFQRFAELYVYCVRGTIDERINVLLCSLGQQPESESTEIAYPLIKEVRVQHCHIVDRLW